MMIDDKPRCGWMGDDELMLRYHDEEWGEKNDRKRSGSNDRGQVFILHIVPKSVNNEDTTPLSS